MGGWEACGLLMASCCLSRDRNGSRPSPTIHPSPSVTSWLSSPFLPKFWWEGSERKTTASTSTAEESWGPGHSRAPGVCGCVKITFPTRAMSRGAPISPRVSFPLVLPTQAWVSLGLLTDALALTLFSGAVASEAPLQTLPRSCALACWAPVLALIIFIPCLRFSYHLHLCDLRSAAWTPPTSPLKLASLLKHLLLCFPFQILATLCAQYLCCEINSQREVVTHNLIFCVCV